MFTRTVNIMVILAVVLSVSTVAYAAPPSPFVGNWKATDVDGSDMSLAIGGKPDGPFKITLTDKYISFCDGEAGIARGTGWLNENDPNLLEADLHLECFTTGAILDFHVTFRYHPVTNTLSLRYSFGQVTIWHRPGPPQPPPPTLGLRVNYGHDWVESFYEDGHMAWVTVTDSDGNMKAMAELVTEPKEYWGGETGFQTLDTVWFDGDGNPLEYPPDVQPYDWVYGWVDNGASAQVQIGVISGTIDLVTDSIEGTVNAPWFLDQAMQVDVECLPWGAPKPIDNVTYGMALPDNSDPYYCSWAGEWNILPDQDVGVGYFGPDGHWVANAFYASAPQIVASESGDWFWTTGFNPGALDLFIYESADEGAALLWQGSRDADESGFVLVEYDDHEQDLVEGNYLVVSDGVNQKELALLQTTITVFDTIHEIMAGIAPAGSEVWAAAGPMEWQERLFVEADPFSGEWLADFAEIEFDITEDMRMWSFSHVYDGDGDANEGSTPPSPEIRAWLGNQRVEGYQWPIDEWVSIEIYDPVSSVTFSDSQQVVGNEEGSFVGFTLDGWELQPGQVITMTGSMTVKSHEILPVSITAVDTVLNVVEGTASSEGRIILCVYEGGCEPPIEVFADTSGDWAVVYGEDFDILPGFGMDATEIDGDGDGTSFDYWVP